MQQAGGQARQQLLAGCLAPATSSFVSGPYVAGGGARRLSCYTTTPPRMLELIDEARGRCPGAHSDEHDGYHLLLDYADVKAGMADYRLFSSKPQVLRPMLPRKPIPALEPVIGS